MIFFYLHKCVYTCYQYLQIWLGDSFVGCYQKSNTMLFFEQNSDYNKASAVRNNLRLTNVRQCYWIPVNLFDLVSMQNNVT